MAHEVRIPRLGWSMEVGMFVGWLKADGDFVQEGDPLYELEGDKASQEIESIDSGILRIPPDAPQPGTELPVGSLLAYLVDRDEPLPWPSGGDAALASDQPLGAPRLPADRVPSSPSARRRARELGVSLDDVSGTGKAGRITRGDVERLADRATAPAEVGVAATASVAATGADRTLTVASPRARRVASELGVDWPSLRGTGRHGRVREQDVRRAAAACATVAAASEPAKPLRQPQPAPTGVGTPITKRRRVIAQRMLASHQTTVPVTLTTRADAANLQGAREQFKAIGEAAIVPTISDIVIKLAAVVLRKHRLLAGRWRDDQLVLPADNELDIGLAVDTDDGLLVPVVRDVAGRSLMEIARTTAQLVQRARAGTLALEQLQGSVFTITNLGAFGIDAFTPVINPPEVAILGIGAIRREAIVQDDQRLAVGSRMTLSLTFDHRMVDGAPAARFLADVRGAIEHPVPYLV